MNNPNDHINPYTGEVSVIDLLASMKDGPIKWPENMGKTTRDSLIKTELYIVIIEDRHTGVNAEIWDSRDGAIQRAQEIAKERCRSPKFFEIQKEFIPKWEFCAKYSLEDDIVWVVKREVKQ